MTIVAESPTIYPLRPQPAVGEAGNRPIRARSRHRVRRILKVILTSEGGIVGLLCLATYLTVAVLLDFVFLVLPGDAVSRMANGFYVLYSRDPHLAAIGFVWNPGQSIADLVPLLFNHLWPALASHDMAGSIVSALCMTGAVPPAACWAPRVGREPSGSLDPDRSLRSQPNDRVLRGKWDE